MPTAAIAAAARSRHLICRNARDRPGVRCAQPRPPWSISAGPRAPDNRRNPTLFAEHCLAEAKNPCRRESLARDTSIPVMPWPRRLLARQAGFFRPRVMRTAEETERVWPVEFREEAHEFS